MSFCTMCGSKLDDNVIACPTCGSVVEGIESNVEYAAPQQTYATPQQTYATPQQAYAAPQNYQVNGQYYNTASQNNEPGKIEGISLAVLILMIVGTVAQSWMIIPLAWCIPMTISYCNKIKRNEPVGTGLKVATLLLVNTIGGILMLVDDKH